MLARRLLILMAVLMGLTALAAGVAPRPGVERGAPERGDEPAGGALAEPLERTLRTSDQPRRIEVEVGQVVVITVEGHALDTVRFADYGLEPVEPDSPARFELLADVPGSYPIELLEAEREIGTLVVAEPDEPAAAPPGPGEQAA